MESRQAAYHDTTAGTHGQDYNNPPNFPPPNFRTTSDVDIYAHTGYSNGYLIVMQSGDWMKYAVNVAQSGTYIMQARVVWGGATGGNFHVEVDGVDKTGPLQIPNSDWNFATVTKTGVQLSAGPHILRIVADSDAANGCTGDIDNLVFELESAAPPTSNIHWLVADHLGTPRIILDKTGSRAGIKRHDYLPFGEELAATQGARTAAMGYGADDTRQQFTSKERDIETGLDYFVARYYSSTLGRFSGVDPYNPILHSADKADFVAYLGQPQKWNRYGYVTNNPLKYVDPFGEDILLTGTEAEQSEGLDRVRKMLGEERSNLIDWEQKEMAGLGVVTVIDFGSVLNRQKFEMVGGANAGELEFSRGMSDIIGSSEHVEYKVTETYQMRNCIGPICMTETKSTRGKDMGGAGTLNKDESLTGNVQIFVSRDATTQAFWNMEARRKFGQVSNDGHSLMFTPEKVDAHEFGHAHNSVRRGMRVEGSGKALSFEKIVGERQGSPNYRIVH